MLEVLPFVDSLEVFFLEPALLELEYFLHFLAILVFGRIFGEAVFGGEQNLGVQIDDIIMDLA